MPLQTTKDLAVEMQLHPRTVKRWWKLLDVPPDACSDRQTTTVLKPEDY